MQGVTDDRAKISELQRALSQVLLLGARVISVVISRDADEVRKH